MHTILLIGRQDDPHIERITRELTAINERYVVISSFADVDNDSFKIAWNKGELNGFVRTRNEMLFFNDIKSVWNSGGITIPIDTRIPKDAYQFVRSEWSEGIKSLWKSIPAKWVNHPDAVNIASNRLEQIKLAEKIGLLTPKTLITNDPEQFVGFYKECKHTIITKTLHSNIGLPEGKVIYTTKISNEDIKNAEYVKNTPCMFQEYVQKKTEFRVTIIGDFIHVAEIYSQANEITKDDWRRHHGPQKIPYLKSKLPETVVDKLLKLMKIFGLDYAAIDMIRTPEDQFVFLEVNPTGRWLWIQNLTGMNIARDIAYFLSTVP